MDLPASRWGPLRSRRFIQQLSPGDLVFHYGHGALRALSEVTASAVPFPRPEHYPRTLGRATTDGWLSPIRSSRICRCQASRSLRCSPTAVIARST